MKLVYIIGAPASGKTSVMRQIVGKFKKEEILQPFAHTIYENGLIQLGRDRMPFGGTDALSMSVQPKVIAWLAEKTPQWVIGEGDRLTNRKFFKAVKEIGYDLAIWYLDTPQWEADERRRARGTRQNMTWVRGRERKVANLIDLIHPDRLLNGLETPVTLGETVWNYDLHNLTT